MQSEADIQEESEDDDDEKGADYRLKIIRNPMSFAILKQSVRKKKGKG
jgi:hypothetical protein